ncbi:MAG: hypothetical protein GXP49_00050 [Deltaproteobacteria bacterium]|nr:hypothetical protein [Deltaproteobacteria bacterium]
MKKISLIATLIQLSMLLPGCSNQESGFKNLPGKLPHLAVPQHPFLGPNGSNNMHDDAYMTDTYEYAGPQDLNPETKLKSYTDGMNTCVTMTFDSMGRMITVDASMLNYKFLMLDPVSLDVIASYDLPSRDPMDPLFPYNDTSGAAYFVMDNHERIIFADSENALQIIRFDNETSKFVRVKRYDLSSYVVKMEPPAMDHVQMALTDWSGRWLWFTTRYGVVGTLEQESGKVETTLLQGEELENSFAVAEDGAYILSDHAMYRFHAGMDGEPEMDWRAEYDRGSRVKPGNFNQGSGSTPQVFGDMVAITDNADPRMNVLFIQRKDGEIACKVPVFDDNESTTENAMPGWVRAGPQGLEYSVIIDNNYGIDRASVLKPGRCWMNHVGNLARVDMLPDGKGGFTCRQVWRSREKSSQVLPKVSLLNGLLYVYTYKYVEEAGDYRFFFTAIDAGTGETRFKIPTGIGLDYANFGPPMAISPDGTAYLGTMKGLLSIRDR